MFSRKNFVRFALCGVLLTAACFQRFQPLNIQATDNGIVFSHPQMEAALRDGNLCVFGEISVTRQSAPNDYQEQMWYVQSTAPGFQDSTEPMKKPSITYGETLPQTSVKVEPKLLREGVYQVTGVVVIYNQKRELVRDLNFNDKFVLGRDDSGKLIVSKAAN